MGSNQVKWDLRNNCKKSVIQAQRDTKSNEGPNISKVWVPLIPSEGSIPLPPQNPQHNTNSLPQKTPLLRRKMEKELLNHLPIPFVSSILKVKHPKDLSPPSAENVTTWFYLSK